MEINRQLISALLMGALLIFGSAAAWEETVPPAAKRPYPESLDQVRNFHDDFARGGTSAKLGTTILSDLTKGSTIGTSTIQDLTGFSIFDDDEDDETFQGVVAINTERGRTVTGRGEFGSVPTDVNYLDIDVRNIIVISINTARGGNAIATSEIVIKPTQQSGFR